MRAFWARRTKKSSEVIPPALFMSLTANLRPSTQPGQNITGFSGLTQHWYF